jgi:hypothetical protein
MNNRSIRTPVAFALKNIDKNIDELVILAWFWGAAHDAGWTGAQLMETTEEALSSDDHHLYRTLAKYCVEPSSA